MSLKLKLITFVSICTLMISMLIVGIYAVLSPAINIKGSVDFDITNSTMFVKDVRAKNTSSSGEGTTIGDFTPGFINGNLVLNLQNFENLENFTLYIDVVNLTTTNYQTTNQENLLNQNNEIIGIYSTSGKIFNDEVSISSAPTSAKSGTIKVEVTITESDTSKLSYGSIIITFEEFIPKEYSDFIFITNDTDNTAALERYTGTATEVTIPSTFSIRESGRAYIEGDTYTVTSIADASSSSNGAFYNSTLTNVTLPDTLTKIGDYAFYGCSSLTSIDLSGCTSLQSIGIYALYSCSSLTEINLSGCTSLQSIGVYALYSCSSLTEINLSDCTNLESIGVAAFFSCKNLTNIDLSKCTKLTSIGSSAFNICSNLISITIPSSVTSIGSSAFANCSRLTTITIPSSVTGIGYAIFSGCTSLNSITFETTYDWRITAPVAGAPILAELKAEDVRENALDYLTKKYTSNWNAII